MKPILAGLLAALALSSVTASAGTLDTVKARGQLVCGANPGLAGFGLPDDHGVYKGLDVDECRALAAAIFNDPDKIKFLPINAKDRPTILASGEIDVLVRNTTWTMSRETGGMFFTGVNYYDGQGLYREEEARRRQRPQARRGERLRAAGHDHRTQPRRLSFAPTTMKFEPVVFATDDETVKAL